jgi:alginate O-acetyltransferase complex protein AlgI
LAFSAQIYFDFSGYSDMAIGLGLLFNFRLPVNFAAPLRASSMLDFWRRWHITLSQWLRDYLYGPLTFGRPMGWWRAIAVMITMTLAGLWHGAGWTFVVWGAYHGCLLIINTIWQRVTPEREGPTRGGQLAGWALTFTAFVVGAVFFRAADLDTSWHLLVAMTGFGQAPIAEAITIPHDWWAIRQGWIPETLIRAWLGSTWSATGTALTLGALAIALFVPDTMEITGYSEADAQSKWRRSVGPLAWRPSVIALCIALLLFAEVFFRLGQVSEFLYFQF